VTARHRLTGLKKLKKRTQIAGLASMTLAVTSLTVLFATHAANAEPKAPAVGSASAPNGDNGDVKVHDSSTAVSDQANNPHVCQFYLDGFNFDPNQQVFWSIEQWAPTGQKGTEVLSGALTMDANGHGFTADQSLPNGHYKLFWNFTGENGAAKQKVFWVKCPATPPTTPPPTTPPPTTTPPTTPPTTPTCTCMSSPPASPTTPGAPTTQPPPAPVPPAPAPTPVSGSLPVTG
jgi:hypothetical protein